MSKKVTTQEFIEKAKLVHGDKYDYSKVLYIKSSEKVCIICPKHGEFWQTPSKHLSGQGCKECFTGNTFDFIEKAQKIHGDKYNYDKSIYKGRHTSLIITCPIHGDFELEAGNHLSGSGCQKCAIESRKNKRSLTAATFIKRANIIHNNKYDYSNIKYENYYSLISIICPIHGKFIQRAGAHLEGLGCPKCNQSKGELAVENYLINYNIKYISQYEIAIDKSINSSGIAYIDFYLPELNIAIEYNGKLHYEYVPYLHNGNVLNYEKQLRRDNFVKVYCQNNNIALLEIKYTDKCIESIISDYISKISCQ